MDASARVNDLIVVATRLIAVMEQEIDVLREMKIGEIRDLQPEKDQLVNTLIEHSRIFDHEPGQLAAVPQAFRQDLHRTMQRFRAAVSDSERALRAAHEANGRVVKAIVDAVTRNQAETATYTKTGTLSHAAAGDSHAPTLLSVNQQL